MGLLAHVAVRLLGADPEVREPGAVPDHPRCGFEDALAAQRGEHGVVERGRLLEVGDLDPEVIDHVPIIVADATVLRRAATMATVAEDLERPRGIDLVTPLVPVCVLVAVMWVAEIVDTGLGGDLDRHGIVPREVDGLDGILWAPFLHGGFGHLIANSLPFLVLGGAIALGSVQRFAYVTVVTMVVCGLGTWLTGPDHSVHIGASGLVFGYLTYLLSRGLFAAPPRLPARRGAGVLRLRRRAVGPAPVAGGVVAGPPLRCPRRHPRRLAAPRRREDDDEVV